MSRHYKRITAIIILAVVVLGLTSCKKETIAPPTVKVFEGAITLNYTSAGVSAEVTDQGGAEVKSRGFVYGLSGGSLDTIFCGSGIGVYSAELNNLQPNTTYVYEAFAKNAGGTGTSGKVTFTTRDHELPTVKTADVDNVGTTTASCGGNVTGDGGANVTERGVCWSTNHNPSLNGNHVSAGSGLGEFACNMTNLSANTTYYVRAYAKNSKGVAYGEEKDFTTMDFDLPEVTTAPVTDITQTTAKCGGEVTSDGGTTVTERGICWSTSHNPTTNDHKIPSGQGTGSFTANITGLSAHTTYYVRAYATNSKGTAYGTEVSFNTSANLPTVSTGSVTNITTTTATGSGIVTNDGGSTVTERGICWSTNHQPTISGTHASAGGGTSDFSLTMTDLSVNTTYYVRAYATNGVGTSYGDEVEFATLSISVPGVTTASVTNIGQTSATGGGNVISSGGAIVTERGICWSTSHNPTTSGNHASSGTGTGSYTVNMTNLTLSTTYYVRAYAINSQGVAYGEEVNFTTNSAGVPSVTTNAVTNITQTTATCGGNVTSDGGSAVTRRGVCWSTSPNPTTNNQCTNNGTGTGSFTSSITGLSMNTTYYVRAYAINSAGTSYGEQKTFTTNGAGMPTVTTNTISNITQTSATCGGNVTTDGGATVTSRGVCWSTSQNPTINNQHTNNGTGTGRFTSSITGLTANTVYYVRAYATNSHGTAYGEQRNFKTSPTVPTVTTSQVSNITETSASCGGNVTDHGGSSVTARGVCWSTSSNPTINNQHTTNGSGTGSFTSSITNLSPGTTYYVRAYATNSVGTGYGEVRTFTTIASKYAYASLPIGIGYFKYPIDNPNNTTSLNPDIRLLGGDYYNGYLYAYGYTDPDDKYYFYKINASTGSIVSSTYVGTDVYCSDCAYDYTTNRLYGSKGDDLYYINLNTGAQTYVGSFGIDGNMLALFCSSSGQLYGIQGSNTTDYGHFYRINKSTGAITLVATLSYFVNYAQSGGFDRDTGTLYWAGFVSDTRSSGVVPSGELATDRSRAEYYGIIATINPNTGSVTVLQTNTGEQCAWSIR